MPFVSQGYIDHLKQEIQDLKAERASLLQRLLDGPPKPAEPVNQEVTAPEKTDSKASDAPAVGSTPFDRIDARAEKARKGGALNIAKFRVRV
jgi:hypothetical protein